MALPRLRIVVFPETPKAWTARSLEHDLAAVGRTKESAIDALVRMAYAHIAYDLRHGRKPLSAFCPAPSSYWRAYDGASSQGKPIEVLRVEPQGRFSCLVTEARENPDLKGLAPSV